MASMDEAKLNKKVYVDISGDIFYRQMIEYFVNEIGSEKILFGSDAPWIDPTFTMINVLTADISNNDKENIFNRNAEKVFNFYK